MKVIFPRAGLIIMPTCFTVVLSNETCIQLNSSHKMLDMNEAMMKTIDSREDYIKYSNKKNLHPKNIQWNEKMCK